MKNFITITTINPRTEGIRKFERISDSHLIIVGDKKTPEYNDTDNLTYLSLAKQISEFPKLARSLPYNHYTRKNIGYLFALKNGATSIYDTDDDNAPYDDWRLEEFACTSTLISQRKYINIYKYFTNHHIWPRGLPLDEILAPNAFEVNNTSPLDIGVWQGLADNDPDVDAIYRLTSGKLITFNKRPPVSLPKGVYAPFNSQNTLWRKELAALMYLPSQVSFRLTDILRGYIAQVIMQHYGYYLGYCSSTVYQERNDHNLIKDFKDEIECYINIKPIVETLEEVSYSTNIEDDLISAYKALVLDGHVPEKELNSIEAWLNEISKIV